MNAVHPVVERLLADNAIDTARLAEGREIADGAGLPLLRVLLHLKLAAPDALATAISQAMKRPIVDLDKVHLPAPALDGFSAGICRELRVLPLMFEEGQSAGQKQLVLAMADPGDRDAGERVAGIIGLDVRPVLVVDDALGRAITRRYESPPEHTVLMLVEALPSDEEALPAEERAQMDDEVIAILDGDTGKRPATHAPRVSSGDRSGEGVFADSFDSGEQTAEHTQRMRRPPEFTVVQRSPFLPPSQAPSTDTSSVFGEALVSFVSSDKKARLRVAADLASMVKSATVHEDLRVAVERAEREPPDEVIVHMPKNDVGTGVLLDRLARATGHGVIVISDDEAFSALPCVRRRLAPPETGVKGIAPLILEGLFDHTDLTPG